MATITNSNYDPLPYADDTWPCDACGGTMSARIDYRYPVKDYNPPIAACDWVCGACGRTVPGRGVHAVTRAADGATDRPRGKGV